MKQYPYYIANEVVLGKKMRPVFDKFSGKQFAEIGIPEPTDMEKAIVSAVGVRETLMSQPSYERKAILKQCIQAFKAHKQELIDILILEGGKTVKDSEREVERMIMTFQLSAEESTRIYGEIIPLDIEKRSKGFMGFWKRVPIGPCLFITPFNFPLNLPAHKIAPAIATGCPFVLKPTTLTPLSASILGRILSETDLPKGAFSILPVDGKEAETLVQDVRFKLISFTGSTKVGYDIKTKAGKKPVILELGGNAACIVDEGVEVEKVVDKLVTGGYYQSGQSCIHVQRIFIHRSIYDKTRDLLVKKVKSLKVGNPKDIDTFMGPMISDKEASRVESWINEAVSNGATLLTGGQKNGTMIEPAVFENVSFKEKIYQEEAFGPLTVLYPFDDFNEALKLVNDSRYGLQAGIFTKDLQKAYLAWEKLEVGGVIINDIPSFRSDAMPYGGVKDSGLGREGVRFAIQHLTEIRLMAVNLS